MSRSDEQAPDSNPYAPPKAAIGLDPMEELGGDLAEVEVIRRRYLNHEASVKAIGTLCLLFTVLVLGLMLSIIVASLGFRTTPGAPRNPNPQGFTILAIPANLFVGFFVGLTLGLGLRSLRNWARWGTASLFALPIAVNLMQLVARRDDPNFTVFLLAVAFTSIIPLYVVHLMVSRKSRFVFSSEYREVIARTPHIRYRISWIVLALIVLLVLVFLLAILGIRIGATTPPPIGPGR